VLRAGKDGALANVFEAGIDARQEDPVRHDFRSPAVAQTANQGEVSASNTCHLETAGGLVPLAVIAWEPCFDDPWLAAYDLTSDPAEWVDSILDVEDSTH
jgi:hypothetical protein